MPLTRSKSVILTEENRVAAMAAKRVAVCRPRLRNALGDIGNQMGNAPEAQILKKPNANKADRLPALKETGPKELEKVLCSSPSPMETSACEELSQAFSTVLLQVKDVDEEDADNPLLCSDYVKDIYSYMMRMEDEQAIRPHYLAGQGINGHMRSILIDWLVQVHQRFKLLQETFFMTVAVLDRFLQANPVPKNLLQLAGVTALFVACKYEEIYYPAIRDFAFVTDHTYSTAQIRNMEIQILSVLKFEIGRPVALHFLRRASKIGEADAVQHTLAKYLMELAAMDYNMVHIPPSKVAAASLCLAMKVLNTGEWTPTLQHYMVYKESDLIPVMQHLAKNVLTVNRGLTKFMSVRNKYASRHQLKVSLCPHLNCELMENLAGS
ncbi:G2/mitotic-specific cyclin-B1-like isoform X2 [Pelobates fuscus]|uniref:G2/mitotic-specific cyclin-B1-like isoform X2 n=1 Tax=Pelobates fuscus TaxID=191477 RepID=UPI002FE4E569